MQRNQPEVFNINQLKTDSQALRNTVVSTNRLDSQTAVINNLSSTTSFTSTPSTASYSDEVATTKFVTDKISEVVGQAPDLLNSISELSNALNNDAGFATTIATRIGVVESGLSTTNSNVSSLQTSMTSANSNISTLQSSMTTANSNNLH
jgi:flagellin-like hook-associated protein FlgL